MSSKNEKYRNVSAPLGYVKKGEPKVVFKQGVDIDGVCCKFLQFIIDSGILEDEDCYDTFIIQSSDEEEIVELPPPGSDSINPVCIDIDDDDDEDEEAPVLYKKEDAADAIDKAEVLSQVHQASEASKKDSDKITHEKIKVKNESTDDSYTSESITEKKNLKRNEQKKKRKTGKESYDSSNSDDCHRKINRVRESYDDFRVRRKEKKDHHRKRKSKREFHNDYDDDDSYSRKSKLKRDDSSTDGSNYSNHSRRNKFKKTRSFSPSYSDEYNKNIKQEEPQHLYGFYHCQDCNITMNSEATYESHINGKKHAKVLKSKNIADTVSKTVVAPKEVTNRYPTIPSGVKRVECKERALVQSTIERKLHTPCPGLDNVIEIQGMSETSYYCMLCDSPCSSNSLVSHLQGYKHQLKLLKHFNAPLYERIHHRAKPQIEKQVLEELRTIEKKFGIGLMCVQKEYYMSRRDPVKDEKEYATRRDMPSTSSCDPDMNFSDYFSMSTIPDTSRSGYYCKICDSHMNSLPMWQNHISGKRHLANVKKAPGTAPSKTKNIPLPNARADLLDMVKDIDRPVIGLNHIREIRNSETGGTMYNCFLCGACTTTIDIIEHLTSFKHMSKYLESIQHEDYLMLKDMQMPDSSATPVLLDICSRVENEIGMGTPEVYVSKGSVLLG